MIEGLMRDLIPNFVMSSRMHREVLIKAFKVAEFNAGVELFKEGQPNSMAYLVVEGEIRLNKKSKLPGKAPDQLKSIANLSKATNSASFRIKTSKDMSKPNKSLDHHEAKNYLLGVR